MTSFPRIRPAAVLVMFLMAGLLLWRSPVMAQETTGSVSGIVQDSTGAAIPHAAVILTNLQNKTERKTVSNGSGEFTIASVASDLQYQVKVTMQGFKSVGVEAVSDPSGRPGGLQRYQDADRRGDGRGDR